MENDVIRHTVAYGIGAFAYALPKEAFAPLLNQAAGFVKSITRRDGAFEPDNMEATENAMGAIAKIAYKHIDGGAVTEADLAGVFSFFPFTSDECEAQNTHKIFLEQISDANSAVHSANIKPAAQEALGKIRTHVQSESADADIKILSPASKQVLASMPDF